MAKKQSQYEFKNKTLFSLAIAIFASLSMVSIFASFNQEIEISKEIFLEYRSTFPEESKTFEWAFSSLGPFKFLELLIIALTVFFSVFSIIMIFRHKKLDGKQSIADLLIILVYSLFFFIFGILWNPMFLDRPTNWIWAFAFSIVCGTSGHLLLLHERLGRKRRNVDTSKFGSKRHKWHFLRQLYEIELTEYRSALSNLIWIGASLGVGLIFSSILQYVFSLPKEIAFSNPFGSLTVFIFLKAILLIIGLVLGLIYQLLYELHDIKDLIIEQTL